MTLENMHNKAKIQGKLSPNFETVVGLREDDSLSTLLFKFCMEKIIRNVKTNPGGTIFNGTRKCLAYADDVVILWRSVRYISETLEDMSVVAPQIGLSTNNTKTKYMINRKDNNNEPKEIEIMGKKFENVESFKYLGSLVTDLNEKEIEIKSRFAAGNKSYHALGPILKKGLYPSQLKFVFTKQL
jgi:hypothetical protein